MKKFMDKAGSIGVKPNHLPWQTHLIRKLNLSSFLGIFNVGIAAIVFYQLGYTDVSIELLICLIFAPSVLIANHYGKYILGSYFFTFMGIGIFFLLSVRMGEKTLPYLYYFPFLIGVTQMLWRKELLVHLILQMILIFLSIIAILYCFQYNIMASSNLVQDSDAVKLFNIIFSFFTAIAFIFIISFESIKQEYQLETIARQKEILLAELYHRVKNNLNLVTSLLNLKKNTITSAEGKKALEETRNLVFSMSMIHDKVYGSENKNEIMLNEYVNELAADLIKNLSGPDETILHANVEVITLSITQAIPCGLILNELITNSFKHAKQENKKMEITIGLKKTDSQIELSYSDNGKGIKQNEAVKNTLGLVLIHSLCEQLDAQADFLPEKGFNFKMTFKKT